MTILVCLLAAVALAAGSLVGPPAVPGATTSPNVPSPAHALAAPTLRASAAPTEPPPTGSPSPSTAASPSPPSTRPVPSQAVLPLVTHIVQPGESLTSIAAVYGITPQAIRHANHIKDPNLLRVGQKLIIPGAP